MMKTPFAGFPPELLAQIAQNAFRPPQMMGGGGGVPGMQAPQQGGGGMGGLGAGLGGLAGMGLNHMMNGGSNVNEQGAVGPGGLAGAVSSIGALQPGPGGQFLPPPMPTDIGSGGGGGFGSWMSSLFQR
jgi:hypothetical protein